MRDSPQGIHECIAFTFMKKENKCYFTKVEIFTMEYDSEFIDRITFSLENVQRSCIFCKYIVNEIHSIY